MSINSLLANINARGGVAQSNAYEVDFGGAAAILTSAGIPVNDMRDLNLYARSVNLPGRNIATADYAAWGHTAKYPTSFFEDDVEVTFDLTNDFFVKRLLDTWSQLAVRTDDFMFAYDDEYRADIRIRCTDAQGNPVYSVLLKDAFPYSVKGVPLDDTADNTIARVGATFAFATFTEEKI